MNCQNCGTQLGEAIAGKAACPDCQTLHVFQLPRISIDGISPTGEVSECLCPACRTELKCGFLHEEMVEYCGTCEGILLDQDLFGHVVAKLRREFQGAEDRPTPIDQNQLAVKRMCPVCDVRMDCHPYYGPGNAIIDACTDCRIVWLDAGELTMIERAPGQRY